MDTAGTHTKGDAKLTSCWADTSQISTARLQREVVASLTDYSSKVTPRRLTAWRDGLADLPSLGNRSCKSVQQ